LRGIRSYVGFNQVGIEYERDARLQGESTYTIKKYLSLASTAIFSFSYIPLRIATFLGIITAFVGFAFAIYVIFLWIIEPLRVSGYASLIVIIALMGGVQLITIGVLGEYIARLSDNIRRKSVAVIAETTIKKSS
jgi:polyisoprenyl-phosphate glycosyltransferase